MTPTSLPGLSPKARALLAAEREIAPSPPELRWRAQLRARSAFGQARTSRALRPALLTTGKRARVLLVAALVATSAFAAWHQWEPELVVAPPAIATGTPPPPTAARPAHRAEGASAVAPGSDMPTAPAIAGSAQLTELEARDRVRAEAPAAPGAPAARTRVGEARRPPAPTGELTLLDSARRAVVGGHFERALRVLEQHRRSFPKSPLSEEREALRVRALQGAGRSTQAHRAAREFEARYPSSVLASELSQNK